MIDYNNLIHAVYVLSELYSSVFLYSCIFLITSIIIFIYINRFLNKKKLFKNYSGVQRIHSKVEEIPRMGGACIFISILFFYFFENNIFFEHELKIIVISFIPIFIISFYEDFFQNSSPKHRLLIIYFSSIFFLYLLGEEGLPNIDTPVLNIINEYYFLQLLFYGICLSTLVNGTNLIDGTNGLAITSSMSSLAALAFMANHEVDTTLLCLIFFLFFFFLIFFLFNFPWGRIFLGDLGAYFCGFAVGGITIIFYAKHEYLSAWGAVLVLFYPSMEVIFSFFRKIYEGHNPVHPDPYHLHLKLFFLIDKLNMRPIVSNSIILPFLTCLWIVPSLLIPWVFKSQQLILFSIFGLVVLYSGLYYAIPRVKR